MESTLNFINKFTDLVRDHVRETNDCIGKDVVDSTATKSGICVDKVKQAYGAKFSMLGHAYKPNEVKQLESFNEDVLVCQGSNGLFFVPVSEMVALGGSVILVSSRLGQQENGSMARRREEVFAKFYKTQEAIRKSLPTVGDAKSGRKKKKLHLFY